MSSSFVIPFLKLYKLWDQKAATVSHQPVVDWTQGEIVATHSRGWGRGTYMRITKHLIYWVIMLLAHRYLTFLVR